MRRFLLGLVLVSISLRGIFAPPAFAQAPAASTLDRVASLLTEAQSAPADRQATLIQTAGSAIDGDPTLTNSAWLTAPLKDPPDLAEAIHRVTLTHDMLTATSSTPNAAAAEAALADVFRDSRFQHEDWTSLIPGWLLPAILVAAALKTLIWNIARWPFDRFLDLLGRFSYSPGILVVTVLILVGIIYLLRRGIRSSLVRQAEITATSLALPPTAAEALTSAQAQALLGHYREACHFVFLSTLLWIEEHGQARFVPASTNREHLARITEATAVRRALEPVVARFDQLWYGQEAVRESDYVDLLALAREVREIAA